MVVMELVCILVCEASGATRTGIVAGIASFELRFPHAATLARAPALVFVALSLLPQDHSPRRGYVSFMVSASLCIASCPSYAPRGCANA